MARKKKEEKILYQLDTEKLSLSNEKHIEPMMQFLSENIKTSEIAKDGKMVNIEVSPSISKKIVKLRVKKYFYQAGLKEEYRIVALPKSDANGFQIIPK